MILFVFVILLNSVGTVILQSINSFDISKAGASVLEGYKDLPIAVVSFLVASIIPRIGYRFALLFALFTVSLVCMITPILAEFWAIKLLFATIGTAFAFVKVSVYSIIGTKIGSMDISSLSDEEDHCNDDNKKQACHPTTRAR